MNETTYKINTDIVSTTMKDKPLIFISEEVINLKRDNDNLKSIIKEVKEYIEKHTIMFKNGDMLVDMNIDELFEILDKEKE